MMDTLKLEEILKKNLTNQSYQNFFHQVYEYSLLPAGKMFRPKLVYALAMDKNNGDFSDDHKLLASLIEIHHTYTLMHDDLPSMDNDDTRRGRPSSHKKFGEWQALLGGDGLLNASYSLISKVSPQKIPHLLKYFSWCVGAKGLILGQALDLSGEMTKSFENVKLTHTLKTARLIQASLVGSLILCDKEYTFNEYKSLHRFGEHLGLLFQFIDDLTELSEETLSIHETEVNPWLKDYDKCFSQIEKDVKYIRLYLNENELGHLKIIVDEYLNKMRTSLEKSSNIIENHIGNKLDPAVALLN